MVQLFRGHVLKRSSFPKFGQELQHEAKSMDEEMKREKERKRGCGETPKSQNQTSSWMWCETECWVSFRMFKSSFRRCGKTNQKHSKTLSV